MKFYLAPMEGLTGYIYRNAYNDFFHNMDKYFTPFIVATSTKKLRTREFNDILKENNEGLNVIPQILTNNSADFLETSKRLSEVGYKEVNLNLGCPSGTVVSKKRGSGFLAELEMLDNFFYEVFEKTESEISVKTRIGKDSPEEFYELINIFNKYPIKELIIHPRIQKQFYKGTPNMEIFKDGVNLSKNPVCFNGNIFKPEDYKTFNKEFPQVESVMIGRGVIANPGLVQDIYEDRCTLDKKTLREFHDRIYRDYKVELSGDKNLLFKMKEMWFYMGCMFTDSDKYLKKIRKADRCYDYEAAVNSLFREQDIIEGAGFHFI